MVKYEFERFVNKYMEYEQYITKSLESYMSGHVCCGSPEETSDSCGNCDGGRCSTCIEVYKVTRYGQPILHIRPADNWEETRENMLFYRLFSSKEEALEFYESLD